MQAHKHLAFGFCVFCNCRKLPSPFRAGSKCTPRCAGLSCGCPGSAPPPRLHLRAAEMKPPGASPCRPQPGFLPLYVQRRGNSFLDTAVTETAPRPFPLSWCWESGKLGSEADPGATCRPTLLSDGGVKAPSCFAIHWPPQDSSQRRKCTKHQGSGFTELLPCTRQVGVHPSPFLESFGTSEEDQIQTAFFSLGYTETCQGLHRTMG